VENISCKTREIVLAESNSGGQFSVYKVGIKPKESSCSERYQTVDTILAVVQGMGRIILSVGKASEVKLLSRGASFTVPKRVSYWLDNLSDTEEFVLIETRIGSILSEANVTNEGPSE
jgi:mannose-6-phosphate isomerase-like protein (cupin superfamily)